jgi:AraC-like DNA-binding protein
MEPPKDQNGTSGDGRTPERERRRWPRQLTSDEGNPGARILPALAPLTFSTRKFETRDQFGAWRTLVAPLVDVALPEGVAPDNGFPAEHTAWNLGSMLVVQQQVPAHSYTRSDARLRSSSIDHWYILLPRSGQTWTEVNGHVVANQPGRMEFRSLGHAFRGRMTETSSLLLYLPRELFDQASAAMDAKNNSILSGNMAALLIEYINGMEARLDTFTETDLPRIVQATRDMIVACLLPAKDQNAVAEQLAGVALMERARRYVQRNLNSAELTSDSMSRALGISRTRLYQLFEPSGGVNRYIQRRRLLAAHAALSDPDKTRRIIDIAESVGFSSAANFSRAFTNEFGYSPREARNISQFPHSIASTEQDGASSFEDWLKMLGH